MISFASCYLALLLSGAVFAAPVTDSTRAASSKSAVASSAGSVSHPTSTSVSNVLASTTVSAPSSTATVPFISLNPNNPAWNPNDTSTVEAERGALGASVLGPINNPIDLQNPDLFAPPTTDAGSIPNAKWPLSLSANRLQTGGWARQQNVNVMPFAQNLAGVNMRLEAGAIRELHWHKTPEWAYVLKGTTQVTSINSDGQNYVANVNAGDLWYFPPGFPHSLQATYDDPDGTEFLLVIPTGEFDEDDTFLLTDWMAHVPAEVLAKNFETDISAFAQVPARELYIFPSTNPGPPIAPVSPAGTIPQPFTFNFSSVAPTQVPGGSYKIADSSTFSIATTVAAAEITLEPGAMRELHWHPTQDEWGFFLEGQARVTLFAGSGNAKTYNYQGGDISYIPATYGHYVENIGNSTLKFLEIFNTDKFADVSLSNWLGLLPPALVQAHLGFSNDTIASLPKTKRVITPPPSGTQSNTTSS